jgi:alpha-L-arabinofuranosidase
LGNIAAQPQVPYLDATATCNPQRSRLAIGLVNRHPRQQIRVRIGLDGFPPLHPVEASLLQADTPLAANTFSAPERVRDRAIDPLPITGGQIDTILPASSVMVLVYGSG